MAAFFMFPMTSSPHRPTPRVEMTLYLPEELHPDLAFYWEGIFDSCWPFLARVMPSWANKISAGASQSLLLAQVSSCRPLSACDLNFFGRISCQILLHLPSVTPYKTPRLRWSRPASLAKRKLSVLLDLLAAFLIELPNCFTLNSGLMVSSSNWARLQSLGTIKLLIASVKTSS